MILLEEIKRQIKDNKKVVIAIEGPSASGKTTFGETLSKKLGALLFHTDNYFLPESKKNKNRLSESGGNIDYERLEEEIMKNLNSNEILSNNFNCKKEQLETGISQKSKPVIIIEGAYSMHKRLRKYYTLSIFITIDEKLQLERILSRNGESMLKKWKEEWIPLENYYFKEEKIENCVDFVIDTIMLPTLY